MGMFAGLWHDDGHGCNWSHDSAYDGEWVADVAPDPRDPNVVFAVTSTGSPPGEHRYNGVIRRDASGTWSDQGTKAELLATRLLVTPRGDGLRFYMSAVEGQIAPDDGGIARPNYVTRVSDDGGQSWREHVLGPADGTFRIQAVDPENPDRLVASIHRASGDDPQSAYDSVLVSSDEGATWSELLQVSDIGGVAFAPGERLFIGDIGDMTDARAPKGLWLAHGLDQPPVKLANADYPVQCLAYQQATDTLYACQHFWFGKVSQQDGSFSALVKLNEVGGFVACDGTDVAAQCEQQLCTAYRRLGHFAQAPLCTAYDTLKFAAGRGRSRARDRLVRTRHGMAPPSAAPRPAVAPAVAAPNALQSPPKPTPAKACHGQRARARRLPARRASRSGLRLRAGARPRRLRQAPPRPQALSLRACSAPVRCPPLHWRARRGRAANRCPTSCRRSRGGVTGVVVFALPAQALAGREAQRRLGIEACSRSRCATALAADPDAIPSSW